MGRNKFSQHEINAIKREMQLPEYARRRVVVIVPIAARATARPDFTASRREIEGHFFTTSFTADVMSTDKSIIEPLAPTRIELVKMRVKLRYS